MRALSSLASVHRQRCIRCEIERSLRNMHAHRPAMKPTSSASSRELQALPPGPSYVHAAHPREQLDDCSLFLV
ncbi:unnamed protein product [Urochloa humidicola]